MHNLALFLILPFTLALSAPTGRGEQVGVSAALPPAGLGAGPARILPAAGVGQAGAALPPFAMPAPSQVRIDRRVIIRISPARPMPTMRPDTLVAAPTFDPQPVRLVERRMGRCIDADTIAGIRPRGDDRLLIYLRDRTMVSAELDGRCRGRMFYSGAYAERSDDGKICVARDRLQSRAGASCGIARFRRLVPAD